MKYQLQTYATGRTFDDTGWILDDPQATTPSLVRAIYAKKQIAFGAPEMGLYRFADWLPIGRTLEGSSAPVTYKSEKLAAKLGLNNLYITFSGYFPERSATMTSCSFKETEAYSVCARIDPNDERILVVASAGNTARAFAKVCSANNIKLLLCVPEDNLAALWSDAPLSSCVRLVAIESGADYFDAIHLGNMVVACSPRFYAEGGAKNVARRDGMGTTMLSAVETIGRIPDYYFQAVGSGTGAIAAWEANLRFIEDGRFGCNKAKLILSQNAPFMPMYNAWQDHSRALPDYDDTQARTDAESITAKVLSNRRPPYSIAGGLYDALCDAGGDITQHSNEDLRVAAELFELCEGVDIHPAAAIAVASLTQVAPTHDPDAVVMLNITGGGEKRYAANHDMYPIEPSVIFRVGATENEILAAVEKLF